MQVCRRLLKASLDQAFVCYMMVSFRVLYKHEEQFCSEMRKPVLAIDEAAVQEFPEHTHWAFRLEVVVLGALLSGLQSCASASSATNPPCEE